MKTLQNFVFPHSLDFGSKEKYYRTDGLVNFDKGSLNLYPGSTVVFDSFYNALSMPLWQGKAGLSRTTLSISGRGKVEIELWHYSKDYLTFLIERSTVELTEESQTVFDLDLEWNQELNGLVYPKIIATEEAEITAMVWETSDSPRREVKLGISITHFNRKNYVIPAMRRIQDNLLDKPEWKDKIDFVVVDNSKNITAEEAQGVKIIPNENTGGSGGFMRGLLHYKNDSNATHVLFMDDDASLEVESIKRAYTVLQFAKKDNTAVGAALYFEDKPDILIERGAKLDPETIWMAKYRDGWGVSPETILYSELEDTSKDYGGWWFFAYPIKYVKHLTPPYFVRGDDVSFSNLNNFDVVFANGISCMAENFDSKFAPMTEYLDMRNKLIVSTMFMDNRLSAIKYYTRVRRWMLLAGRYGYGEVLKLALKDYLNLTPEWLVANANMQEKMKEIRELAANEFAKEVDFSNFQIERNDRMGEHAIVTLIRYFLTPLKKDKVVIQRMEFLPIFQQIVGYKRVLTYSPKTNKGFIVEISKGKLFKGLLETIGESFKIFFNYPRVRERLLDNLEQLTSEEMWEGILRKK